jgi:hypothetical protein
MCTFIFEEREAKIPQFFKDVSNLKLYQSQLTEQESKMREEYEHVTK